MDVNKDGCICCAGTEQQEASLVYMYLWDIRKAGDKSCALLSKYEDSHSDDITQVKFHPDSSNTLITGSTDGLISVFDVSKPDEEDALLKTMNTESSVSKLGFFGTSGEFVYSTTHIETIQFWDPTEGTLLGKIDDVKAAVEDKVKIEYLIDCIYHKESERLFVAGGTHSGYIELLHTTLEDLEPFQSLHSGHSATVRTVCYLNQSRILYTGDEGGVVCSWAAADTLQEKKPTKKTAKARKSKADSRKPYKK